jgi:(R,R)-butanediol dehydrogenase/meso-butanediol dehydrogenase/diacetyl reductase
MREERVASGHAARYVVGGGVELGSAQGRAPGPGEVRIRPAFVGLCGTDLHVVGGDMDARVGDSVVFGHEVSGIVDEIGPGVASSRPGDHVAVMPLVWDGTCATCRRGHVHVCENLRFLGIDEDGALQRTWTLPSDRLVALPPDLPLDEAALVEPVAVAIHDVRRAELEKGDRAVIIGGGPIGLLIWFVARNAGAETLLVELDPSRRAIAERLGVRTVNGADPVEEVRAWCASGEGSDGADVVFEASGSAGGLATAIALCRTRGTVVAVGIHAGAREIDMQRVFLRELTITGARVYTRDDFQSAIMALNSGAIPSRSLITSTLPLAQVDAGLDLLGSGSAMKVLIDVATD